MPELYTGEQHPISLNRLVNTDFNLNHSIQGLVRLAADMCDCPIALINLLDDTFQYTKAGYGATPCTIPKEDSICVHTMSEPGVLVITDAAADALVQNNRYVAGPPDIRFYAGAPLVTSTGLHAGALCVLDTKPRKRFPKRKREMLQLLAQQALYLMELQAATGMLEQRMRAITVKNTTLANIAHMHSHDFRGPVATLKGLMNLIKEDNGQPDNEYLRYMEETVNRIDEKIHYVVQSAEQAKTAYQA